MKSNKINNHGFTLVEVLVAVGVIAVASVAFIPSFTGSVKNKALQQSVAVARDAISNTRNRALTQTGMDVSSNYTNAGVKATRGSGELQIFRTSERNKDNLDDVCKNLTTNTTVVIDSVVKLPGNVVARVSAADDPTCIFFEYGTGDGYITKGSQECVRCEG